jgi:hypothetical protein
MALTREEAIQQTNDLIAVREAEHEKLTVIHDYLRGKQKHAAVPKGNPRDVVNLAKFSRVNIMEIVVSAVAQTLYVDGYRSPKESDESPAWEVWQKNKMDAGQIGVHRAALAYGASYVTVLPGTPLPVIRGYSPRDMTTLYSDEEPDWPQRALRYDSKGKLWRLYDDESIWTFSGDKTALQFVKEEKHGAGYVPIVRFLNQIELDCDNPGEVEPLIELQDQIDHTTFSLLVAQHYAAFRQRYIIGWVAEDEKALLTAAASRIMTFEDTPEDIKVGEFEQTQLDGYLESREASLRHAATISQTPVHELIGQMVNLSAEALVAAEAGQRRKVNERQASFGESWEQVLELAATLGNYEVDEAAEVRWRDTESRALSTVVDALGKMATMLGIPSQELWERVPGVTQQDVERWKETAKQNDAFAQLGAMLGRQAAPAGPGGPAPAPAPRQLPAGQ